MHKTHMAIAATLIFSALVVFAPGVMYAQQASPPLVPPPSPPPPVPGLTMLSPSQAAALGAPAPRLPLPPQAQTDHQKNVAILDELFKRIGGDTSQTHLAAVIKQMQSIYPGQVHCPSSNGAIHPANCYVESRPLGAPISPPIAP
jgi:hypothetical protein